jgi:hypothetical protein
MAQHFGVELELIAEMIIDGGDVRAGAGANIPNRRFAITDIGEYVTRRLDQTRAGILRGFKGAGDLRRQMSNSRLKHMFELISAVR